MATTLSQLGVTFGVGCMVLTGTLCLFAGALCLRITHIAPRCEARPRNVIYHPHAAPAHSLEPSAVQNRGNPLFGWIFWVLQLSYHQLLEGVPGTGTRNDGVEGHLLKLNLDAIVMLRFHALGLRITFFAMCLYCGVALPVYFTSRCFDAPYNDETGIVENCTLDASYNLTRYERLTLANVPPLHQAHAWDSSQHMITFRLYLIVVCTYVVAWYTCYELQKEWIDLLAMRRVYYLETNLWKERREELKATMLYQDHRGNSSRDSNSDNGDDNPATNGISNGAGTNLHQQQLQQHGQNPAHDDSHLHLRDAWIPHPEQRDTTPNIELYSVLVGGLPRRPRQAVTSPEEDLEAAAVVQHPIPPPRPHSTGGTPQSSADCINNSSVNHTSAAGDGNARLDWQLSVTSAFFDYCVPNQPGFTSSVAAVTILPSAREMASAWKKWYGTTKKLQRLRFIRRQLLERGFRGEHHRRPVYDHNGNLIAEYQNQSTGSNNTGNNTHHNHGDSERVQGHPENEFDIYLRSSSRRDQYTNEILGDDNILGHVTDDDVEAMFLKSLQMGPEQTSVYSMELARGASKCCPHGCCEEKILFSTTEELLEMEAEAVAAAHQAFLELEVIRKKAVLVQPGGGGGKEEHEGGTHHRRSSSFANEKKVHALIDLGSKVVGLQRSSSLEGETPETSIESRLFGKGQEALNKHSSLSLGTSRKRRTDKIKARASEDTPLSPASTAFFDEPSSRPFDTKPAAIGNGPIHRSRPRLDTDDSSYFPSMIRMAPSLGTPTRHDGTKKLDDIASEASAGATELHRWDAVRRVATECQRSARTSNAHYLQEHRVSDGIWYFPSFRCWWGDFWKQSCGLIAWSWTSSKEATDLYARDSSYAVVTFTSRQAAIAARKCLADGRGAGKWITIDEIPVPPLADASAFNICDCRGCCRPVTVTLNDQQKIMRSYM